MMILHKYFSSSRHSIVDRKSSSCAPRSFSTRPIMNNILQKKVNAAFIFPGQGSQYVGMGKDLYIKFKIAKEIFGKMNSTLGYDLLKIMVEGPAETLNLTENAQPAILAHSIAVFEILKDAYGFNMERTPISMLGHSLGEFTALCAAEAFSFEHAVRLVHQRGKLMQNAVRDQPPESTQMVAVLIPADPTKGTNHKEAIEKLSVCAKEAASATGKVCDIANINAPSQVVLSGHTEAITKAVETFKQTYPRIKAKKLTVSAPFHSALMKPVAEYLVDYLKIVQMRAPLVPVLSNVTAREHTDLTSMRSLLLRQVTEPVQWLDSITYCRDSGIQEFVEIGPGTVLTGIMKAIDPSIKCRSIGTFNDF